MQEHPFNGYLCSRSTRGDSLTDNEIALYGAFEASSQAQHQSLALVS